MAPESASPKPSRPPYDAHADLELSTLLAALDELSESHSFQNDAAKMNEMSQLTAVCVRILETRSASAEIFIQLAKRTVRNNDYARLDGLGKRLAERYSVSEIAEVIRQCDSEPIKALAYEALMSLPVDELVPLFSDDLYSEIATIALSRKAEEFDSEEADLTLEKFIRGDFPYNPPRDN